MTDRPTLAEAMATRYRDAKKPEPRRDSAFNREVRELAERTAENPALLGILDPQTRNAVENYTAWRDSLPGQTDDTEGTS